MNAPERIECPACGESILPAARKCKHCGEWVQPPASPPAPLPAGSAEFAPPPSEQPAPQVQAHVENRMVQSILVTLLCCLPLGIAATVQSSKVNELVARGDISGAMAASKQAETYANIGVGISAVFWALYFIGLAG